MALQKSTRSRKAAPVPVSPDALSCLIRTVAPDGRNLDDWRGELVSALIELQQRRQADANRAAGVAKRTARQRNLRADMP
jgi:hypothetical protein